jgi:hypothetical protein
MKSRLKDRFSIIVCYIWTQISLTIYWNRFLLIWILFIFYLENTRMSFFRYIMESNIRFFKNSRLKLLAWQMISNLTIQFLTITIFILSILFRPTIILASLLLLNNYFSSIFHFNWCRLILLVINYLNI